jgi:hypothetical protein
MNFPSLSAPFAVSPTLLAVTVGAVFGVVAFLAIFVASSSRPRRRVVTIPPYATGLGRVTPMPPARDEIVPWPLPPRPPSTELSATALARMGIPVGPFGERAPVCEDDLEEIEVEDAHAVSVAPVVVLAKPTAGDTAPHPLSVIPKSSSTMRTPPSGVERASTRESGTMMRAAPIADLELDDAPTEIAETVFDEPPRPRMRSEPPKIRPIVPKPPRFQRGS